KGVDSSDEIIEPLFKLRARASRNIYCPSDFVRHPQETIANPIGPRRCNQGHTRHTTAGRRPRWRTHEPRRWGKEDPPIAPTTLPPAAAATDLAGPATAGLLHPRGKHFAPL